MAVLELRRSARLTLPAETREALRGKEGDDLEAEIVAGGVLLRPVDIVRRDAAWDSIRSAMATVRPTPEQASRPLEQPAAEIQAAIDAVRRAHAAERRRS